MFIFESISVWGAMFRGFVCKRWKRFSCIKDVNRVSLLECQLRPQGFVVKFTLRGDKQKFLFMHRTKDGFRFKSKRCLKTKRFQQKMQNRSFAISAEKRFVGEKLNSSILRVIPEHAISESKNVRTVKQLELKTDSETWVKFRNQKLWCVCTWKLNCFRLHSRWFSTKSTLSKIF